MNIPLLRRGLTISTCLTRRQLIEADHGGAGSIRSGQQPAGAVGKRWPPRRPAVGLGLGLQRRPRPRLQRGL
jgi:hypothetical protein